MKTGTITLGSGTEKQRTIQLTDMLRCEFKDHRLVTVAKDEEGNYLLAIENPSSTGRLPETKMYLTEGSFISIVFTILTYMAQKDINLEEKLKEFNINGDDIHFEFSFNEDEKENLNEGGNNESND